MSVTIPSAPIPRAIQITSQEPTFVSESHSLQRYRRSRGAHRWRIGIEWTARKLTDDLQNELIAALVKLRGQYETAVVPIGAWRQYRGAVPGGGVTVGSNGAVGDTTVALSGYALSAADVLKAGDMITFTAHTKTYLVTADANSDGSGDATVAIHPGLYAAVTATEVVNVSTSVAMLCSLDADAFQFSHVIGPAYDVLEAAFVEVLS